MEEKDNILLAPNGRPSNLSPEDWAYVRSDEFKAFFGDWEAREYILSGRYVCHLTGNEFPDDGVPLTKKVPEYYEANKVSFLSRDDIGDIVLDAKGVRDSIAHGPGRMKSVAFAAVPDVITKGMVVQKTSSHKGKDVDACVLMAPVKISDEGYVAIVLLRRGRNADRHRFFLHEVVLQKNLLEESFKTGTKAALPKENMTVMHDGDIAKLLKKILSASKVVDENGEPKALYHGSTRDFDRFEVSRAGDNTGLVEYTDPKTGEKIRSDSHAAMFFTDYEPQAVSYAMLGRHGEICGIHSTAQDVASSLRSGTVGGFLNSFKTKEDFLAGAAKLVPFIPSLANLPPRISALSQEERDALAAPVWALRDEYAAYEKEMAQGGMSNQYNNTLRQAKAVEGLVRDFDRLRRNDATVCSEFGPLSQYDISLYGATGNAEVHIYLDDDRRVMFRSPQTGLLMLDAVDDATAERCKGIMRHTHAEAVRRFNAEVQKGGYSDATRVYRVFLKAERPFEHDYKGSAFPDKYLLNEKYPTAYVAARQVRRALLDGADMVVYKNIRDPFEADSYGVFDGGQVLIREVRRGVRIDSPEVRREDAQRRFLREYGVPAETVDRLFEDGEVMLDCRTFPRRSTETSPCDETMRAVRTRARLMMKGGEVMVTAPDGKELCTAREFFEKNGKDRVVHPKTMNPGMNLKAKTALGATDNSQTAKKR